MRLAAFLLLFLVFAVAACSSVGETPGNENSEDKVSEGEVTEVVLTPSEQGSLKLTTPSQEELAELYMEQNPGYSNPEIFVDLYGISRNVVNPESAYIAAYETGMPGTEIGINTLVFNSNNLDSVLDAFISHSVLQGGREIILHKGNAIVIVWADSRSDLPLITDIADKLSERLGMKVLDFNEPPAGTPD